MSVAVRATRDPSEIDEALALRRKVFVDEQGVDPSLEYDGRDGKALHLVAVQDDGTIVGTCRLLADGPKIRLGRMVVAARARRRGIGLALLTAAEREAGALGGSRMVLSAQLSAQSLYAQAGYETVGGVFVQAGIEHVWMEKPCSPSRS